MQHSNSVIRNLNPALLVLSPGPSGPKDAGVCIDLVTAYAGKIPLFGVCLGHQVITTAFGGVVDRAPHPMHGKTGIVYHDGKSIYEGIENPVMVGRYHSLCATELPSCLEETATCDGVNMGVRHKELFVEGVQFHPESILTATGPLMIKTLLHQAEEYRLDPSSFLAQRREAENGRS